MGITLKSTSTISIITMITFTEESLFFMKKLKKYSNLHRLYRRSVRKFKIPFFICLIILIPVFAIFVIANSFELMHLTIPMICLTFLLGISWLFTNILTKMELKQFSPHQLNMIDNEVPSCAVCEGFLVTSQSIVRAKTGLEFVPMTKVLWVYALSHTTRYKESMDLCKSTSLIIAGRNHKKRVFHIKNNRKAFCFIQSELLKHRLDIVFGYNRKLEDIYKNDINKMIDLSQEYADKRRKEM